MIPSSRWFPTGLQNRAAWFDNFNTQFSLVGTTLGFTAPDVAAVSLDNDIMQFLAQTNVENDSFIDAARQYRNIMTEGYRRYDPRLIRQILLEFRRERRR